MRELRLAPEPGRGKRQTARRAQSHGRDRAPGAPQRALVAHRPMEARAPRLLRSAANALRAAPVVRPRQEATRLGHGVRARRDVAALRAHGGEDRPALARSRGRAPAQAQLLGAALVGEVRARLRARARDAVRPAGAPRSQRRLRDDCAGPRAPDVPRARARARRVPEPRRVSGAEPTALGGGRAAPRQGAEERHAGR